MQLQIELHDGVAGRRSTSSTRTAPSSRSPRTTGAAAAACRSSRPLRLPADAPAGRARLLAGRGAPAARRASRRSATGASRGATSTLDGERYGWSKDREWRKFLDLPRRTEQPFELALERLRAATHRSALEAHGWRVRDALDFDVDLDAYRDYIAGSRGEFTVAKDQNVRLRTGWFSDRSATYLAAGRPVITQDTGFGDVLPTGDGLFAVVDARRGRRRGRGDQRRLRAPLPGRGRDRARALRRRARARRRCSSTAGSPTHRRATQRTDATAANTPRADRAGSPPRQRRRCTLDSTVLALIPHFQCEEWLDDCLASLAAQTRPLDGIVVIDDASDEPPIEIVRAIPQVTLLHAERNVGPYRLVQQVIEETDYDALPVPGRRRLVGARPAREAAAPRAEADRRRADRHAGDPRLLRRAGGRRRSPGRSTCNAQFAEQADRVPAAAPDELVSRDLVMRARRLRVGAALRRRRRVPAPRALRRRRRQRPATTATSGASARTR